METSFPQKTSENVARKLPDLVCVDVCIVCANCSTWATIHRLISLHCRRRRLLVAPVHPSPEVAPTDVVLVVPDVVPYDFKAFVAPANLNSMAAEEHRLERQVQGGSASNGRGF